MIDPLMAVQQLEAHALYIAELRARVRELEAGLRDIIEMPMSSGSIRDRARAALKES